MKIYMKIELEKGGDPILTASIHQKDGMLFLTDKNSNADIFLKIEEVFRIIIIAE